MLCTFSNEQNFIIYSQLLIAKIKHWEKKINIKLMKLNKIG